MVVPSSAGGNYSFEQHFQSSEERANLDCFHHSHGHSGIASISIPEIKPGHRCTNNNNRDYKILANLSI